MFYDDDADDEKLATGSFVRYRLRHSDALLMAIRSNQQVARGDIFPLEVFDIGEDQVVSGRLSLPGLKWWVTIVKRGDRPGQWHF